MRSASVALAISILCAVGSVIGADPLITSISVLMGLVRVVRAWIIGRRYVVPAQPTGVRPYRLQILR